MIAPEFPELNMENLFTKKCLKSLDNFVPKKKKQKASADNGKVDSKSSDAK